MTKFDVIRQNISIEKRGLRHKLFIFTLLLAVIPIAILSYFGFARQQVQPWQFHLLLVITIFIACCTYFWMIQTISGSLAAILAKVNSDAPPVGNGKKNLNEIAESFEAVLEKLQANTENLERIVFQITTLSDLTELTAKIPYIDELLKVVLAKTMTALGAQIGSIMMLTEGGDHLKIMAIHGLEGFVQEGTLVPVENSIAGRVIQDGKPLYTDDIEADPRFHRPSDPKYEGGSFICMPLTVKQNVIGVLNLSKKKDRAPFTDLDELFLVTIINHIGFAVENARLYSEARNLTINLEEKVKEKTRALERAHLQILQAEKLGAVGQFVSSVAHELNNPLASIIGYAELLKQDLTEQKYKGQMNKVLVEASRCVEIVRRLLTYSHRSQIPQKEEEIVENLIADVLEAEGIKLVEKNVKVHLDLAAGLPSVYVEKGGLHQVLVNLIDNAVAAMARMEGERRLDLKSHLQEGRILIECRDNGPGIPPDILEDVFKPFFTTKETGKGVGLGLAICTDIVERNGGALWVESVYGDGAAFFISLPAQPGRGEKAERKAESEHSEIVQSRSMGILVIDDEEAMNDFVRQALTRAGHQVDVAFEGEEGLRMIEKTSYDLILSDIKMAGLDGMLFFHILKKEKPHLVHRIIFMTGALLEKEIEEFLQSNRLPVLQKPFYMNQLIQMVNRVGLESIRQENKS